MKLKVFSIYDTKVEMYLEPVTSQTRGAFIRSITESLKNPQHQFAKFPSDYLIVEIGDFDQTTGMLIPYNVPQQLGSALEYMSSQPQLQAV